MFGEKRTRHLRNRATGNKVGRAARTGRHPPANFRPGPGKILRNIKEEPQGD